MNLAPLIISQALNTQAEERSDGTVRGAPADCCRKRKTKAPERSSKKGVDAMTRLASQLRMAAVMASTSRFAQAVAGSPTDGVAHAAAVELLSSRQQPPVVPVSPICCAEAVCRSVQPSLTSAPCLPLSD